MMMGTMIRVIIFNLDGPKLLAPALAEGLVCLEW